MRAPPDTASNRLYNLTPALWIGLQDMTRAHTRRTQSAVRAALGVDERGLLLVNGAAAFRLVSPLQSGLNPEKLNPKPPAPAH